MKIIRPILKYTGYLLGCTLVILLLALAGLKIYDIIRMNRIKSSIALIQLGDPKEKVIQNLGEPNDSWNRGDEGIPFLDASYYPDSGLVYGSIFRFRMLSFADDDFVIRLNESNTVHRIIIPEE